MPARWRALRAQMGKRAISSEIGGGGRATPASLAVAARGLRNVLAHIGVRPDRDATRPAQSRSQLLALSRKEHYVPAPATGRLAPARGSGTRCAPAIVLGHIHPLEDPLAPPVPVAGACDGVVAAVASIGVQERRARRVLRRRAADPRAQPARLIGRRKTKLRHNGMDRRRAPPSPMRSEGNRLAGQVKESSP